MSDRPYQANRVLSLLSKMFNLAVAWGWRSDNPVKGIERYQEHKRDRWLSDDELGRLCRVLDEHPNVRAANAVRLQLLTGARLGEVLASRKDEFDLRRGVWTKPSHQTKQKRTEHISITLRALSYVFFILGAAVPLLRIFSPHLEDAVFSALLGAAPDGSAFSAEGSLVLIGAGGVFALADKLSGASAGWRRYVSTALQLDRMLLEFRLEWNAYPAKAGAMEPEPDNGIVRTHDASRLSRSVPESMTEHAAPGRYPMPVPHGSIELRYASVSRFCLSVLTVVRDETIGWAEEFTRSASEFEQQLHSGIFGGKRPRSLR